MNANVSAGITATRVPDNQRLDTLPKHFARHMLTVENRVYDTLQSFSPQHGCAYWHYYELSNGGFYMAPETDKRITLTIEGAYHGEMSADAAGITVCLYAFEHLANKLQDEGILDHHSWLRDFVSYHAERTEIYRAID